jgi:uncharacterized membrane protein YdbT with pleckstrin-like domain
MVDQRTSQRLHKRLPIDAEEEILGVFPHHWFSYASVLFIGVVVIAILLVSAILLTSSMSQTSSSGGVEQYRSMILTGAAIVCISAALGTYIPIWLKSQEQLVITDEALLQVLQPSLFSSKVSQLSLEHVADVSVRKDFFGSIFGFGTVTIETPGEQDNYDFSVVSNPDDVARQIITVAESFNAALQSGRIPARMHAHATEGSVKITTAEYEEFQRFQAYRAQQQAQSLGRATVGEEPQPTEKRDI